MSAPSLPMHLRCPTCEELRVGFTYRELINGLCRVHALEQASGSFVKLTYRKRGDRTGYGWLRVYRTSNEVHLIKFARTPEDSNRIFSEPIHVHNVQSIVPMFETDYLHMLVNDGKRCVVQHFGRRYSGRIIDSARTRVLVRFQGTTKDYERWKPVYAVQPPL